MGWWFCNLFKGSYFGNEYSFLRGIDLVYPYSSEPGTPNSPYEYDSKQYQFMSVANATAAGKAKKLTPADKGNNITTDAFIYILIYLYILYMVYNCTGWQW